MKLLIRTVKNYLLFSVILVSIFTPLFYLAIQKLFIVKMDEELREHKEEFTKSIVHLKTEEELHFFNLVNKEFQLTSNNKVSKKDSLFTQNILEHTLNGDEMVPHRILRTSVTINKQHYELQIKESLVNSTSLITAIMSIQIIMLILMMAGFTLINRKLSKAIWGPFYVILDKLKRYNIDQENALVLPRSTVSEFRDLSDVITRLIEKNHETFLSQKEFTENASHEMQTPLAICRSKLELLSQTKELTQEQAELVGALSEASDRISRLNRNLLLLAKIENQQFQEHEAIDLIPIVTKLLKQQEEQIMLKNIMLIISHDDSLIVQGNITLTEILLSNLIINAIRHSPEHSTIGIRVHNREICLTNKGIPFKHPSKIFGRFHRESKSPMGSGLGLAIVKKICDLNRYRLCYQYINGNHEFLISF